MSSSPVQDSGLATSSRAQVPADVAPASLRELAEDCRHVSRRLPVPAPRPRLAGARPGVVIGPATAAALEGYSAYGA